MKDAEEKARAILRNYPSLQMDYLWEEAVEDFVIAMREAHAAGRREGLEEAAKVVERESYATLSVPSGRHWWERDALKLFARDIRALADRDAGGGE